MKKEYYIQRHTTSERVNHWLVAICFILSALSGLSFFHPGLYPLAALFGGGTWARILHPFFAVALVLFYLVWFFRIRKDTLLIRQDWQWAGRMPDLLRNRMDSLPPVGKYNFGQKMLSYFMLFLILILLVSGVTLWQPWFAGEFSIALRRITALLHALAAFAIVLCFIVHVYAAYWTTGAIPSMITGWVSKNWARHHSELWYEKQMAEEKREG